MAKIRYFNLFDIKNPDKDICRKEYIGKSEDELKEEIENLLADVNVADTFARRTCYYMHLKKLTTKELYDKAYIDRRLLHKITKNSKYHTSKKTAFALCIAFELSLAESVDYLSLAGYSFSPNDRYDCLIKYVISQHVYEIDTINSLLYDAKLPCIGE